ncbi:hypothetical protein C8Q79DRAFT_1007492 [Trametes meyenii]|nr:hypothetical protein C8Q79DRAFT_1007492 [Trametes meyenii]
MFTRPTIPICTITLRIPAEDASLPTPSLKVHFCPMTTRTDSTERRSLRSPPPPQHKAKARSLFPKGLRPLRLFQPPPRHIRAQLKTRTRTGTGTTGRRPPGRDQGAADGGGGASGEEGVMIPSTTLGVSFDTVRRFVFLLVLSSDNGVSLYLSARSLSIRQRQPPRRYLGSDERLMRIKFARC